MSFEHLCTLVRRTLELPDEFELLPDMPFSEVPGWDSLGWVNILNAISGSIDGELPLEDIVDVETIGQLHKLVA
ncbi:MAG: hypothetical protein CMF67_07180 [Magnetovibrio sp.]|nr:hypothetical protein [Magnetovibrio sp.]|tara:strand:- start:948 stop:1169 length:222 start_codon:yes stop_codon:yes gene_type:complete